MCRCADVHQKVGRAFPRQLCNCLIEARRGVVVKAVLHTWLDECLKVDASSLQRRLILRPFTCDAIVFLNIVQQQRRPDLGCIFI
jgi:hypothetical protein